MGMLDGLVAIVTGGAGGIGSATARAMSREGAGIVVADRPGAGAPQIASEIVASGGRAVAIEGDIADEAHVHAVVDCARRTYGRLDILHNNAAVTGSSRVGHDVDVLTMEVEVWDRVMAVNVRGPMLGCKHAIPLMLESGGGSIVNTASAAGLLGSTELVAYGTSKGALLTLTKYIATAHGKQGIRCNAIVPGAVLTPSMRSAAPPEEIAVHEESHLTPFLGTPEDVAELVVFLGSPRARYVTGQLIGIDGGYTAHNPTYAQLRRLRGQVR